MNAGTTVSLALAALLVAVLGVTIRYFGMVHLIAGYDAERVTDEEGLADFVGLNALYVAAITGVVAVVEYTRLFGGSRAVWILYVLGVVLLTVRMVRGARRYETTG